MLLFSVLLVPMLGSSMEELLGLAVLDKPSRVPFPFPMQRAAPFPVRPGGVLYEGGERAGIPSTDSPGT